MTYPVLAVEVAFGDDPLDTSLTWDDVTASVLAVETNAGRQRELDAYEPGTATITLDNTDREFDPLHASGPWYGELLPGKQVRIQATWTAVTYTLFQGWVDGWPQSYDDGDAAELTVTCTDGFGQLAKAPLPSSVYAAKILEDAPWYWWRLREKHGSVIGDSSGNNRLGETGSGIAMEAFERRATPIVGDDTEMIMKAQFGSTGTALIQTVYEAAGGTQYTLEAWVYAESPSTAMTSWFFTVAETKQDPFHYVYFGDPASMANTGRLTVSEITLPSTSLYRRSNADVVADGQVHHIIVRQSGSSFRMYVDGEKKASSGSGAIGNPNDWQWQWFRGSLGGSFPADSLSQPLVGIGEIAFYDRLLTDAEALEHYEAATVAWDADTSGARIDRVLDVIGWPSAMKDTATGTVTLGPAIFDGRTVLEYAQATAAAEQGQLFCNPADAGKVTFRDRHYRATATRSITSQASFSDAGGGSDYAPERLGLRYDESAIVNECTVEWTAGTATFTDAASVTAHGVAAKTVATELSTYAEAYSLAEWIVARYKDPIVRCSDVALNPAASHATFAPALDTQIDDRVTVRKLPQGVGSAIEKDVIVEGITHRIGAGVDAWETTFYTSAADAGPWFVWDVSEWDDTTRWVW